MAIIESTATALIRFTGLGIIVFNKEKQRGEIAIIRDEKHKLSIKIQQPKFKDGIDKDLIIYEDIANFENLPKDGLSIEISTNGESLISGFEVYQSDDEFNRLESEDTNDFRWLVNVENLTDEKTVASKSKSRYPLSKLFIENGLFYVHKLDTELFFEKVEKDENGNELDRQIFGNVAETIGVKLQADEVTFKIKFGEQEEVHTLKHSNFPYRIEIKNMDDSDNAVYSDMADYYKYIASETGKIIDLQPIKADSTTGAISREDFCHPINGGGFDAIEDLEG